MKTEEEEQDKEKKEKQKERKIKINHDSQTDDKLHHYSPYLSEPNTQLSTYIAC